MSHPTVFLVFAAEIWPTHPSSQPPRELEFLNLLILLISVYLPYFTSRHHLSKTFPPQGHGSIFSLRASSCNQKEEMCGMSGP